MPGRLPFVRRPDYHGILQSNHKVYARPDEVSHKSSGMNRTKRVRY